MFDEDEIKRIYNTIIDFQNIASKYKIKSDYKKLRELTGISIYELKMIMDVAGKSDIASESEIDKFRNIEKKINVFLDTFEYTDGFSISDGKFSFLITKKLNTEFPEISQRELIEQTNAILKSKYERMDSFGSKSFNEFVEEKYGIDGKCALATKQSMDMYYQDRYIELSSLISTQQYLKELIGYGYPYIDDYGNECTLPISSEEKEKAQKELAIVEDEISRIQLQMDCDIQAIFCDEGELAGSTVENMSTDFQRINKAVQYIPFLTEKNIDTINRRRLQNDRIQQLKTEQQQAILSVYLEHCFDKQGFLIPDHFGTGIQLIHMKVGKTDYSYQWTSPKYIERYDIGDPIPRIESNDIIYSIIAQHKTVFFTKPFKIRYNGWLKKKVKVPIYNLSQIKQLMKKIESAPSTVKKNVFDYLRDELLIGLPRKVATKDYYIMISEFTDILSRQLPINTSYSIEKIYRIVYEICNNSNGELIFSNELVNEIAYKLRFKYYHWLLMMYVHSYCEKYKEIDRLLEFIENEKEKYNNKGKELE